MSVDCRKRVIVSGRVQGVGFRYFVYRLAQNYPITGYVKNLPNGDVEILAEGERGIVEYFLDQAAKGPGFVYILDVKSIMETPQKDMTHFEIRY
jgi:acylphosphatase